MRSFSCVALALTSLLVGPAVAQTGSQSNLVLTILGGAVTGHDLWTIDKQPLCVIPSGGGACSSNYDTLRLSRSIGSSIMLGVSGSYYPSPHVGVHAELSYLGLPTDASCSAPSYNADPENKNQQLCDEIQAQTGGGGAISVFAGVVLRAAPRRTVSPYLRGSLGFVNQAHSSTEVVGGFTDGTGFHERLVIADPKQGRTSVMLGFGAGFTSPLSAGYQFRIEVRDAIVSLERLTGPANALGAAPTATRTYHHIALALGIDVVLERKRGRRY
jgi:hypothetical protein